MIPKGYPLGGHFGRGVPSSSKARVVLCFIQCQQRLLNEHPTRSGVVHPSECHCLLVVGSSLPTKAMTRSIESLFYFREHLAA